MPLLISKRPITNFGGNLRFCPRTIVTPASEAEVVRALNDYRGRKIRVGGRLHSWSGAPEGDDVYLDLRRLNSVQIVRATDGWETTLGAGCRIKQALAALDRQGLTLPTVGLIDEQTIAGAAATGTHGSGRHCLSHYVTSARIAHYDAQTGFARISEVCEGDALRAARCSLGGLGVIVALRLRPRQQYNVEERIGIYPDLEAVLAHEAEWPLQQFFYMPWLDRYLLQRRKETSERRRWFERAYRAYWFIGIDVAMHLILRSLVQTWQSTSAVKFFYRYVAPSVVPHSCRMVGKSQDMLTMQHELLRHIEVEVFVRRSQLAASVDYVRRMILHCGRLSGLYTHHYPVCVRRVLADDTLLSMSSGGDEDYYAISLISYDLPAQREGFFQFATAIAQHLADAYGARCHWGKVCPLPVAQVQRAYPELDRFREICSKFDSEGRFRNDWLAEVMGAVQGRAALESAAR